MTIAAFEGTMDDYDETETKLVEPDSRVGRRRGGKSDWWEGVSFAELLDELRFACTKGGARTAFIDSDQGTSSVNNRRSAGDDRRLDIDGLERGTQFSAGA